MNELKYNNKEDNENKKHNENVENNNNKFEKIVVFDLDETLGFYTQFGIFIDCLKIYFKLIINQNLFNNLLDLYNEFHRPGIITLLNYLKKQKENYNIDKILIYTNNQGSKSWVNKLKNYFEYKINYKLFDQVIGAYKINNKIIEICRTSHNKTYKDLCNCSKLDKGTKVCFIDDLYHHQMNNSNVYYIHIKPYYYDLDYNILINRFLKSKVFNSIKNNIINNNIDINNFKNYVFKCFNSYNYFFDKKDKLSHDVDKILYKKILEHLQIFINMYNK